MLLKNIVYNFTHPLLRYIRNHRLIIRKIFGVRIPTGTSVQFDPTTVLLSRAVREICTPEDSRVLEVGVGQGALVLLSLAKDRNLQCDGIDCSSTRVASSLRVAEHNQITINCWVSDLFSQVPWPTQYDLIFFNPPYVPTEVGEGLRLTERLQIDGDQVWDGGKDGTKVLREFLKQATKYTSDRSRIVFGVQEIFVPDHVVINVITDCGYDLVSRITKPFIPSMVYVVSPAAAKMDSQSSF
ncbi:MAG TPA: methyltransferase [Planctomycetaceae bacterium]|nr:methyltransferase [Planctomycetaceae bacterium]